MKELALHMRSPESGPLGQGVRYATAGAVVAVVYVLTTLFLASVAGLPFQVALVIGYGVAVTTHFLAQRHFVWADAHAFALPVGRQVRRYLTITLAQYGLTALSTAVLPSALGLPTNIVYVATVVCVTGVAFLLLRSRVFHPEQRAT
jgi:putative flippase GtrA